MELLLPWMAPLLLTLFLIFSFAAEGYDPLDPDGNITVTFDIYHWWDDGYVAKVTIQNFYMYRHIEKPGWAVGWAWTRGEVIWTMTGAVATKQGNCSQFTSQTPPHSCRTDPVVVDQTPDAAPENRTENCCRGGVLQASAIDPADSVASFEMVVGNLSAAATAYLPANLTLMAPGMGYNCGEFADVPPTLTPVINGRREEQVFRTWKSACTYSSFVANKDPVCCVSLSTFYNPDITPCPTCACACRPTSDVTMQACVSDEYTDSMPLALDRSQLVRCSDHMCPVRVHWHIKANYRGYWRVKVTVSNYHYGINFSDWNVVVQHPGFSQHIWSYSFNSSKLDSLIDFRRRLADEVALFWGLDYYNTELPNAIKKDPGSVTTDILLKKDPDSFTLSNGWAFPRRIYFNGENCEMPLPQEFPALPNAGNAPSPQGYLTPVLLLCLSLRILTWL